MTLTTAELAHCLLTFIAKPEKSEARNRWKLLETRNSYFAVWTCVRSRQLVGMALAGLEAYHRNNSGRVQSTVEARVHPATCLGPQENKTSRMERLLELFHFSEHVFQRLCSERGVFQCATCDGATTRPKRQREPLAGFALSAGDEGDPFAQEDPLDESEEVHGSKREPTHPEGIFRRARG